MKKWFCFALLVMMLASLTACQADKVDNVPRVSVPTIPYSELVGSSAEESEAVSVDQSSETSETETSLQD